MSGEGGKEDANVGGRFGEVGWLREGVVLRGGHKTPRDRLRNSPIAD